jgi:hypothetical protein
MKTLVVKLDSKIAKIYDWPELDKAPKILEESHIDHHSHLKKDEKHFAVNKFFHLVAQELDKSEEVYLLGNHITNAEFKHHLEKHNHPLLLKKIVGTDTITAHSTDADVREKAKDFFNKYRTFTKNY